MKEIEFTLALNDAVSRLSKGAILLVGDKATNNIMTIGWCLFGVVWGRPVCQVLVRGSRYTHKLMEENEYFTVAVPKAGSMRECIAYCGSHSGRDVNKASELALDICTVNDDDKQLILPGFEFNFVCRKVFAALPSLEPMDAEIRARFYDAAKEVGSDGDPHTMYYGEIVTTLSEW